jgi:CRP-like cAMP-binding protein
LGKLHLTSRILVSAPSSLGELAAESSALFFNLQRTIALYSKKNSKNKKSSSSLFPKFQDRTTHVDIADKLGYSRHSANHIENSLYK